MKNLPFRKKRFFVLPPTRPSSSMERIYHEYLGGSLLEKFSRFTSSVEIYRFYQGLLLLSSLQHTSRFMHDGESLFTASFTLVIMQVRLQYFFSFSMLSLPEKKTTGEFSEGKLSQLDSWPGRISI